VSAAPIADLVSAAAAVLRGNDVGDYTKPSPRLYPHQWNWDSAFAAVGWAHLDWPRAVREIDSLLTAQWTNGMLPHIRYNPEAADYHPGPEWWPNVPVRRPGVLTSGISQPPVLPTAVYIAGLLQADASARLEWWARVYEPVAASLLFFARRRTIGGSPLIAVLHPWESGLDNSPRWDFAVRWGFRPTRPYRRHDNTIVDPDSRPRSADYDLYMYLVEMIAANGYEMAPRLPESPFAVYDVLFNAVWYRAAMDLNRIAQALGRPPAVADDDLAAFRAAYHATLWNADARLFRDFDVRARAQVPVDTAAGLCAIYGGLVDAAQASAMFNRYRARCAGCHMVPSTPPDQEGFDAARYWRGPVWVNVNWMLARGLEDLGLSAGARAVADGTLALIRRAGLHEYYHPYTGAALGGADFTWTSALAIDLVRRPVS
jgi:hypothetical protein